MVPPVELDDDAVVPVEQLDTAWIVRMNRAQLEFTAVRVRTQQVIAPRQLGDRREDQIGVELLLVVEKPTHARRLAERAQEPAIRACRLDQELAPVGQKEQARARFA